MDPNVPAAVEPEYRCGLADETIELYRGLIEIDLTNGPEQREAIVRLDWRPQPHIAIHSSGPLQPLGIDWMKPHRVKFPALGIESDTQLVRLHGSFSDGQLALASLSNLSIGQSDGFASVVFHVVNLREYHGGEPVIHRRKNGFSMARRLVLEACGWRITFDSVERQIDVIDSLKQDGRHASRTSVAWSESTGG